MNINTKMLTRVGLMTAIICISAPISIPLPISPVPITLGTFALYLSLYILEYKQAILSTIIYLFLGAIGLPVFSGYSGGFNRFFGAGGGYLVGYIFLVIIGGYFVNKYSNNAIFQICGCFIGTIITYLIGTFWLAKVVGASFIDTIPTGVLVYLPLDSLKIVFAHCIGTKIKKRLN